MSSNTDDGSDFNRQFAGKNFLMTGVTQGLGETTARLLVERGVR